jgi:hypothetical protein
MNHTVCVWHIAENIWPIVNYIFQWKNGIPLQVNLRKCTEAKTPSMIDRYWPDMKNTILKKLGGN